MFYGQKLNLVSPVFQPSTIQGFRIRKVYGFLLPGRRKREFGLHGHPIIIFHPHVDNVTDSKILVPQHASNDPYWNKLN